MRNMICLSIAIAAIRPVGQRRVYRLDSDCWDCRSRFHSGHVVSWTNLRPRNLEMVVMSIRKVPRCRCALREGDFRPSE
jgi:hypothetical protein